MQHALRAYTPRDQKAVQAAAQTFRPNPQLDTVQAITELGVGEALISFLDEKGTSNIVQRAYIVPPASQIGPVTDAERSEIIANSIVAGVYENMVDRESAYEKLKGRAGRRAAAGCATAAATRRAIVWRYGARHDGRLVRRQRHRASQGCGGGGDGEVGRALDRLASQA